MYRKAQVWIAKGLPQQAKQVLLFQLIDARGGGWHPVTGSVEKNEDVFAGAIRETLEETGFDSVALGAQWFDLQFSFQYQSAKPWQKGNVEEHCFGLWIPVAISKSVTPQLDPKEHTDAKWVSIDEALSLLRFPHQKNALQIFAKKI